MDHQGRPTFGALLQRFRLAAGLSQEELAERSGISTGAISALERGVRRSPYQHTVARLATGLDLSPQEYVLFEAAARNPQIKMPDVSPNCPRFLIVHGNADPFVPRNNSNLFFGAMRDAGRATDLTVKRPGGDPAPTIQAEVTTLANWFDKQLTPE